MTAGSCLYQYRLPTNLDPRNIEFQPWKFKTRLNVLQEAYSRKVFTLRALIIFEHEIFHGPIDLTRQTVERPGAERVG